MKKIIKLAVIFSVIALFSSCASFFSKSEYDVKVTSSPSGAKFVIKNAKTGRPVSTGTTPATVRLKASTGFFEGADYTVTFTGNGKTKVVLISRGLDGWYLFGNILVGGFIGWVIIDPLTGAMFTLSDVHGDMGSTSAMNSDGGLKIMTLSEVPENQRSKLVPITVATN